MTVDDNLQADPFEGDLQACEEFQSTEGFDLWTDHISNLPQTIELPKHIQQQDYNLFHYSLTVTEGRLSALTKSVTQQISTKLDWWGDMTELVVIKTVLTLYALELELQRQGDSLNTREKDILRWTVLYLHLGSAKQDSRTSKQHVLQLISARYFLRLYSIKGVLL